MQNTDKRSLYKNAFVVNGNCFYPAGKCVRVEYDCFLDGENGGHFYTVSLRGCPAIIMRESDLHILPYSI